MNDYALIHKPSLTIRTLIVLISCSIVFILKQYFYDNIYLNFEENMKNPNTIICILPYGDRGISDNRPVYNLDGLCHKEELNSLIGKKLTMTPQKVETVKDLNISNYKQKGTYIDIDRNKIVKGVYCIK